MVKIIRGRDANRFVRFIFVLVRARARGPPRLNVKPFVRAKKKYYTIAVCRDRHMDAWTISVEWASPLQLRQPTGLGQTVSCTWTLHCTITHGGISPSPANPPSAHCILYNDSDFWDFYVHRCLDFYFFLMS